LFELEPRNAAPWQIRRAEEFIEANWSRPINMQQLTAATGINARSLFRAFQRSGRGSPMAFLRTVRLRHARSMLETAKVTTVTDVALACGFEELGRFGKLYQAKFGELPSETLRRVRR
jgi:transcriptional regulator GlxA family with amidase domain